MIRKLKDGLWLQDYTYSDVRHCVLHFGDRPKQPSQWNGLNVYKVRKVSQIDLYWPRKYQFPYVFVSLDHIHPCTSREEAHDIMDRMIKYRLMRNVICECKEAEE